MSNIFKEAKIQRELKKVLQFELSDKSKTIRSAKKRIYTVNNELFILVNIIIYSIFVRDT